MAKFFKDLPSEFHTDPLLPVWRYMSFAKFASLITRSEIFMSRVDKFVDLFEGAVSRETFSDTMKLLESDLELANRYSIDKANRNFLKEREFIWKWFNDGLPRAFISCWYLGRSESLAMWKIYGETHESIAIKSSVAKLMNAFPDDVDLLPVQYMTPEEVKYPTSHRIWQFGFKRLEFAFESELRCVKFDTSKTCPYYGHNIKVDLKNLIEEVIISPRAPYWLHQTITEFIDRFDLKVEVKESNISGKPWSFT